MRWKLLATLVVLAAVVTAGLYWWYDGGRHHFFPKRWGVVEEGIVYRSGQVDESLIEDVLREHGIEVIVDLAEDRPDAKDHTAEAQAAARLGIEKLDLWGLDGNGEGDPALYASAVTEMVKARDASKPVLVHCAAGSQRTGGAVAYYRMLVQGWSGERAFKEYMGYHHREPRHTKLQDFVNAHMQDVARQLVEARILDAMPETLPFFGRGDE